MINPFGRHFCRPCDRRHIVAQMAGDEMSLTRRKLFCKMSLSQFSANCPVSELRQAYTPLGVVNETLDETIIINENRQEADHYI